MFPNKILQLNSFPYGTENNLCHMNATTVLEMQKSRGIWGIIDL